MESKIELSEWRFKQLLEHEERLMKTIHFAIQAVASHVQKTDANATSNEYIAQATAEIIQNQKDVPFHCWVSKGEIKADYVSYCPDWHAAVQRRGNSYIRLIP